MATANGRIVSQLKNSFNLQTGPDGQIPQYMINGVPNTNTSSSLGYDFILDTQYPDIENSFQLTAGVWTRIPNNSGFTTGNLPDGVSSFYDPSELKFNFDQPNSVFFFDVLFSCVPATSNAAIQIRSFVDSEPPFQLSPPSPQRLNVDAGINSPQIIQIQSSISQNTFENGLYFEVFCDADAELFQLAYQVIKVVQK